MNTNEKPPAPVEEKELRAAMRYWATGVTVVTAAEGEARHGMTVSSFTSLSLNPPLVMVSLEKRTRTHGLVMGSGAFGVTVLAEAQRPVSDLFAGREREEGNRFEGIETFYLESGSPFLKGGQAFFDCRVVGSHDAGSHTVVIGEVVAVDVGEYAEDEAPLLYYNQGYRGIERGEV